MSKLLNVDIINSVFSYKLQFLPIIYFSFFPNRHPMAAHSFSLSIGKVKMIDFDRMTMIKRAGRLREGHLWIKEEDTVVLGLAKREKCLMLRYNDIDLMRLLESSPKMSEIESRLAKHTFLSRNSLPGYLDGSIFLSLLQSKTYPDRSSHPHFYHWYILMRQFAPLTIRSWVDRRLYYHPDDALMHVLLPTASSPHNPTKSRDDSVRMEDKDFKERVGGEGSEGCYMIDVLLKEGAEEGQHAKQLLGRLLEGYGVEILEGSSSRQLSVRCSGGPSRRQEVVNLVSRTLEYSNLQVKKCRSPKSSPVRPNFS